MDKQITVIFPLLPDLEEFNNLLKEIWANRYGLKVICDAAHAFGVMIGKKSIMHYGDRSAVSFLCDQSV